MLVEEIYGLGLSMAFKKTGGIPGRLRRDPPAKFNFDTAHLPCLRRPANNAATLISPRESDLGRLPRLPMRGAATEKSLDRGITTHFDTTARKGCTREIQ